MILFAERLQEFGIALKGHTSTRRYICGYIWSICIHRVYIQRGVSCIAERERRGTTTWKYRRLAERRERAAGQRGGGERGEGKWGINPGRALSRFDSLNVLTRLQNRLRVEVRSGSISPAI
jgi:hypothetical protein